MLTKMSLKSILAITLLALVPQSGFAEGGSHGGGGSGVVLPNGDVRFVDLLSSRETADASVTALGLTEVRKRFYNPNRSVTQLAQRDPSFFKCAATVLSRSVAVYPVFEKLIAELPQAEVLQVQFQIASIEESATRAIISSLKVPAVSTASHRLPMERQAALATYANNQVWVTNRLYARLSATDQCGVSVHEAFRQLNFSNVLPTALTQDEIEVATRHFMNAALSEDSQAWSQISTKLLSADLQNTTCANKRSFEAERSRLMAALSENMKELSSEPGATPRYKALVKGDTEILEQLKALAVCRLNAIDTQIGQDPPMEMVINSGIIASSMLGEILTTPLTDGSHYDVITLKKSW